MGDQSQNSVQNDGQKTAICLGKRKYFSHFLPQIDAGSRVSAGLAGHAQVERALCISCF
jgi:hypothetical protein